MNVEKWSHVNRPLIVSSSLLGNPPNDTCISRESLGRANYLVEVRAAGRSVPSVHYVYTLSARGYMWRRYNYEAAYLGVLQSVSVGLACKAERWRFVDEWIRVRWSYLGVDDLYYTYYTYRVARAP